MENLNFLRKNKTFYSKIWYYGNYHGIPAVLLTGWGKTYEAEIWMGWMFFF